MEEKSTAGDAETENKHHYARLFENKYWTLALAIAIIAVNLFVRVPMLRYQGLFEPDGFFYYAVIRQAVQNNFVVSNYLNISGWPSHNFIGESPGLIYLTVVPYFFLRFAGISYYTIMRLMPVLFGVLDAIVAYYLARYLANSRVLGLLAMFFVSVSSGNIARTASLVYRGDSFISLFLILGLIFMLRALRSSGRKSRYLNAAISAFVLSLGMIVWTGYSFIIAVYMLALLLLIVYGFVKADEDLLRTNTLLTAGLLGTFLLDDAWWLLGLGRRVLLLGGANFFVFWAPILLGNLLAIYLVRNRNRIKLVDTALKRACVLLVAMLAMLVVFFTVFSSSVNSVLIATGATGSIGTTTQELQRPYYAFLFASFSFQLYLAPLALLLFVFFANKIRNNDYFKIKGVTINMNKEFLVIFSYLAVTAFLQSTAIRWNALLSIPLAIFAAYCAYAIGMLVYERTIEHRVIVAVAAIIFDILVAYIVYFNVAPIFGVGTTVMVAIAFLITAVLVVAFAYDVYAAVKSRMELVYVCTAFIAVLLLFNFYETYISAFTASQADGINTQFLQAMAWMQNNTAANATVWAIWPDGSVVEGWANRTSYMDSVGGENGQRIYYSARFLFNTSDDTQYLYSVGKPQYIVARSFWYQELGGLAVEGNITNASAYGYAMLSSLNITQNGTARFYSFTSDTYPYYKALMVLQQGNSTNKLVAYLGTVGSDQYTEIKYVMLYNTTSNAYNVLVNPDNSTANYTLLVSYAGTAVSGGVIFGPAMVNSNIFRLTFLCNYYTCPYDNANVTLTAVYINSDTRIFKVNYS
jgi:asparagine N-glycosylation enzyme membrane subunit Stt3